ncbi:MAG: amidohydrolase family protein [Bacteroidia bacterium]
MRNLLFAIVCGIGLCLALACTQADATVKLNLQAGDIAFVGANVLPMTDETILTEQTIWVRDGKVFQIGAPNEISLPEGITQIDAKGAYLIPGLAEMHAHIPQNDRALAEETLFLYLSQGITTIRGMLGHPDHLALRQEVAAGTLLGPRIYTAGPSLNGNSAPDIGTAERLIEAQKAAGYDFLKLHPGLSREVFDAVVAKAKAADMSYSGHISAEVGIDHALASDYASIDHLDRYLDGLIPAGQKLDPTQNGFFGLNYTDAMDASLIPALAQKTADAGIWNVPTMSMLVRWTSPQPAAELAAEPEMQYMDPKTVANWEKGKFGMLNYEKWSEERIERFFALRRQMLKALQEAGAGILLGSDAPQVFNVPGFSIHHEMAEMVNSGLSPYEVLRAGTINPAIFFGKEGQFGMIAVGASADLILLSANPLESVNNVKNALGVMRGGVWLSQKDIETRLAAIAAKYKK